MLVPDPQWDNYNPATVARPVLPAPWNSNTAGFYFVAAGGTNVGNGFPADPRATIPTTAAAGSVIVLSGIYATAHGSPSDIKTPGTEASPVWIMSHTGGATVTNTWEIHGDASYLIIDGIDFDFSTPGTAFGIGADVLGLCLRNGSVTGSGSISSTSPSDNYSGIVAQSGTGFGTHGQFIFYNLAVSLCGNWLFSTGDPDAHGFSINNIFVEDVWILNCNISYCSGNGIQFGAFDSTTDATMGRRIYVDGNTVHHIAQGGIWFKRGDGIVCSNNRASIIRRDTPSAPNSPGFGGQYGPKNAWFVNNIAHDAQCGIQIVSASLNGTTATVGEITVAGNLLYDLHDENGGLQDWRTDKFNAAGVCISLWPGASNYRVVNNTCYDYDVGTASPSTTIPIDLHGNIFSGRNTGVLGGDVLWEGDPGSANGLDYNLFEDPYVDDAGTVWTSVAAFTKGTGNVQGTPDYVNAAGSNFVLNVGSPGEGEGADSAIYAEYLADFGVSIQVDINDLARPQAGGWSIGAFETSGITLNITTLNATTLTVG